MSIVADKPYEETLNRLARLSSALDKGDMEEANRLCRKIVAFCEQHEIRSSVVAWNVAIFHDYRARDTGNIDDFKAAVLCIQQAVALDKLNLQAWRSLHIIVDRLRDAFLEENGTTSSRKTDLYNVLVESGEAEVEHHIAQARFLFESGAHHDAVRILDAVTLLHPKNTEAIALFARVLAAAGDTRWAKETATKAALVRLPPAPFMMQPVARA